MSKQKFNYHSDMKSYYQTDEVAEAYYKKYIERANWRGRIIANRERQAVAALLRQVNCSSILEIPTGTGKLAPVFARKNCSVLACDISENMLAIAKREYERAGHSEVRFQVADAEDLSMVSRTFDTAVCLRLLHRVPRKIKKKILRELAAAADHVIVSTGIESPFQKWRRSVREKLLGGDARGHCYETMAETKKIFRESFRITKVKAVLPILSQEYVFLLAPLNE